LRYIYIFFLIFFNFFFKGINKKWRHTQPKCQLVFEQYVLKKSQFQFHVLSRMVWSEALVDQEHTT